jgi:AAA+ ATPase superfamily predicted ATPase
MFEQVDKDEGKEKVEAAGKVLVTGIAGIGKTTLLNHITYEWSKGTVFSDKFDFVFKVSLKSLLDEDLGKELKDFHSSDRLIALIHRTIEQQQIDLDGVTLTKS